MLMNSVLELRSKESDASDLDHHSTLSLVKELRPTFDLRRR